MREGWVYKKLGEVGEIITGSTPSTKESENYSSDDYCFIKPSDLPSDGIGWISSSENHISKKGYSLSRHLPKGSVLVSCIGSIGKVGILQVEAASNQQINAIIPHSDINSVFLSYSIFSIREEMINKANAPVVPIINKTDFSNYKIPVPPLSEQQRIVSELDLLSSIIEKKKAQLKEYDQLAQSIFYDMFGDPVENEKGWEVKKLVDNVHEMFLGPFGSALKVDSYVSKEDSYCMVYEQKHAIQGTINLDNHYINKDKFDTLQRFEVKPHDFIMSCRGTIGKLYQLPNNAPNGIIHPSLMKIRIKEDVYNSTYFQFMLVKIVANESTNGNCVQMAITAKELGKKELPVPPLSLQQSFASKIEGIEHQKALIQQSIAETETLFNSRMDYYFN